MNKLTALSKLAGAYYYLFPDLSVSQEALDLLSRNFHYIRRSMLLDDLRPQPKDAEGLNPKGPVHF